MTNATAPDLGPLTWVKGEIDAALSRAREILDRGAADADPAGLQFAHTTCTRCAAHWPSSASTA